MKKIMAFLASAVLTFGASAYAAGFTAVCNSQEKEVKVAIFADNYSAPIMVYLTDADVPVADINSGNADAVKLIAEVAKGASGYEATLKLPADIEKGYYTLTVADYGATDDTPKVSLQDRQCRLYVADTDEINAAIEAVNGANQNTILGVLTTYKDTLSVDTTVDFGASTSKAFVAVRGQKTYSTLSQIQADYALAQAIGGLTDVASSGMGAKLGVYATTLGIELDEDYVKNAEAAHELMSNYFTPDAISEGVVAKYAALAKEAIAVATINNSNRTEIDAVLVKYNDVFRVDLDGKYANTNKISFNKALERKNFTSAESVKKAFDAAIKNLSKPTSSSGSSGVGPSTIPYKPSQGGSDQPSVTPTDGKFNDLQSVAWAKDAIENLADLGIISGYADGSFGPNNNITRNEFLSILVRAFGLLDETAVYDFTDGDANAWYAKAVASAKKAGIVAGYADGSFGDGTYINRQDMASFIYRVGRIKKAEGKDFADSSSIADYAKEAVDSLSAAGVINGMEDNTFAPYANATRAQVAVIINAILGGEANE